MFLQPRHGRAKAIATRVLLGALGVVIALGMLVYIAFQISPWPAALIIRRAFNKEAVSVSPALDKHVPAGITAQVNEHYDRANRDAYLDVFYPSEIAQSEQSLLTVVWVHGGGWVSGSKEQVAVYARILAGKGYTVVGVDYSIAPGETYPTPIRQVNTALSYLAIS
jgi:acetyl esterase